MATDPRLAGFDADAVRTGLRLAMQVGLPPVSADQPKFYMPVASTSDRPTDQGGVPFSPNGHRSFPTRDPISVPCAVQYRDGEGKLENFGVIVPAKVVLTFLDEDYAQVEGFEFVVIGGTRYFRRRTEVPRGLVSVGLFKVHCVSEDES